MSEDQIEKIGVPFWVKVLALFANKPEWYPLEITRKLRVTTTYVHVYNLMMYLESIGVLYRLPERGSRNAVIFRVHHLHRDLSSKCLELMKSYEDLRKRIEAREEKE